MRRFWKFSITISSLTLFCLVLTGSAFAEERFILRAPIDGYLVFVTDKATVPESNVNPISIWRDFARNSYSTEYIDCQRSRIHDLYSGKEPDGPPCQKDNSNEDSEDIFSTDPTLGLNVLFKSGEQTVPKDPIDLKMLSDKLKNLTEAGRSGFWHHDLCNCIGAIGGVIFSIESPIILTEIGDLLTQWQMTKEMKNQIEKKNAFIKDLARLESQRANSQVSLDTVVNINNIYKIKGEEQAPGYKPRWERVEGHTKKLAQASMKQAQIDRKISSIEADLNLHEVEVALKAAILSACAGIVNCPGGPGQECEVTKTYVIPGQYVTRGDPIIEIKLK